MIQRIKTIGLLVILVITVMEIFLLKWTKRKWRLGLKNSISNMSIGIGERFTDLFLSPYIYLLFQYLYNNYRVFTIPVNVWSLILLLIVTDFIWYWYHRSTHRVNIFWAAHIVHHQCPDYNLSVAARITLIQSFIRTTFWIALPVLGFSVNQIFGILLFHGVYSFFTHTQFGKKLHFLEGIFITPSLHGVHHASNEKYIDKNFGDIFVFWDKLFGTFVKEGETPQYGLTKPFTSHSFLWQHFHYYVELFYAVKGKKGWINKVKIIFGPPEIINGRYRSILERKWITPTKYEIPLGFKFYILIQILSSFLILLGATWYYHFIHWKLATFLFAMLFLSLINIGAIMEKKRYLIYIELSRLILFLLFSRFLF